MNDTAHNETGRHHRSVPQGYRQGLITAITVLLGFSLTLLRYWSLPNHSLNRTVRPAALARRPLAAR